MVHLSFNRFAAIMSFVRPSPSTFKNAIMVATLAISTSYAFADSSVSTHYNGANTSKHSHKIKQSKVVVFPTIHTRQETAQNDALKALLRQTIGAQPSRVPAKIIKLTNAMKILADEKAAQREARLLQEIDQIEFKYYRPNEAYDSRFPSIVYLDTRK